MAKGQGSVNKENMGDIMIFGCTICKEPLVNPGDVINDPVIAPIPCGHMSHQSCFRKFEMEEDVVLKVCCLCKVDYGKMGTVLLKPMLMPLQLGGGGGGGDDDGGAAAVATNNDAKAEIKLLKTDIKNLKMQIKKDAKIIAETKKATDVQERFLRSKIHRLVQGISGLNASLQKYCDKDDFEGSHETDDTVLLAIPAKAAKEMLEHNISPSKPKSRKEAGGGGGGSSPTRAGNDDAHASAAAAAADPPRPRKEKEDKERKHAAAAEKKEKAAAAAAAPPAAVGGGKVTRSKTANSTAASDSSSKSKK